MANADADALCAICRPIPITLPQPKAPDRSRAERFLALLDPGASKFTFQTFDDDKERRDRRREAGESDPYAKVFHGTLAEHFDALARLNAQGAGIFVTVNETDFRGRTAKNVVRARALFVDLDGAPIGPVVTARPAPHVIVESSPGKGHGYWMVADVALGDFTAMQKALAARFGGDPSVHDLPRVMRLPGFFHRKADPFMVRVIGVSDSEPLKASDFPKVEASEAWKEEVIARDAGKGTVDFDEDPSPWSALNTAALANLSAWVPSLFKGKAQFQPGTGAWRVWSRALGRNLQEDLSLAPSGIKDWGVHDQGDEREGKRSPIDVVMEHGDKDFAAAVEWLREKLGNGAEASSGEASSEESASGGGAQARASEQARQSSAQPIPTFKHGEAPAEPGPQLIRNRLPEVGKGLLSGQWGTFKTFVFINMSCSVMVGGFWTGEPVYRQGGVLLFAPEGARGIGLRLAAMVETTLPGVAAGCCDLPPTLAPKPVDSARLPFEWTDTCPPLLGTTSPLPVMVATAEQAHERFMREFNLPLVMIGIDTMSAAKEDNAEVARVMARLEKLSVRTGTAVVGIDHYGKNQEAGTRGASAKEANSDFVLSTLGERALSGDVKNTRLALRKLRDGPQGIEFPFHGRLVDMGRDQHGFPVTSRVIDWNVAQSRRKTTSELMLEAALASAISGHGEAIRVDGSGAIRAARTEWVRMAFKEMFLASKPDASSDTVKKAFKRALEAADGVAMEGDFLCLKEAPF